MRSPAMEDGAKLRTVRFTPYLKGHGPTFTLHMWDTNLRDWRGQTRIAYELRQHEKGKTVVLFTGNDFAGSPMHSNDGDRTVAALMGFLTLRPGDTDRDYFDNYTDAQRSYCEQHAEALSCEVVNRFGDD